MQSARSARLSAAGFRAGVAGVLLALPLAAAGARAERPPTERPDERRSGEPRTLRLFGRPLEVRGELEASARYEANPTLGGGSADSELRFGPELLLDVRYAAGERVELYAELLAALDASRFSGESGLELDAEVELTQAFADLEDLLGSGVSLRVGRQAVFEDRGWWWDADLDAVRLFAERGPVRAELAAVWQLTRLSTDFAREPEDDEVLRMLGRVEWSVGEDAALELFALAQDDRSPSEAPGRRVRSGREDPSDADVVWLGARASATRELARLGELELFLEGAWMRGREEALVIDEDSSRVASRRRVALEGVSLGVGLSWELPWPLDPTLTLEYAFGSGDGDPFDSADESFRQTGLQTNQARFDGAAYFDVYGALLRPELSNLHLVTVGVGVPLLRASSVDLVLHLYRQVHAAPTLRARGLDALPDGEHRSLGQALDLVLALREWERLEVELVASAFRAGPAFGTRAGRFAFGLGLQVEVAL